MNLMTPPQNASPSGYLRASIPIRASTPNQNNLTFAACTANCSKIMSIEFTDQTTDSTSPSDPTSRV